MEPVIVTSSPGSAQDYGNHRGFATPILLVVFNRPETTKAVVASLRAIHPVQLFVAADGPRPHVEGEGHRCTEARRVATSVDWPCKVQTRFQERNLGLALNMSGAVTWFLNNVEYGIILEDDCVPVPSFYRFCEELLLYYRDAPEVMHISGNNFQYGRMRGNASYYFSKYAHCWGWATWRRAWQRFAFEKDSTGSPPTVWARHWQSTLDRWGGVSILPNRNLVTNIGFGDAATHTKTVERYSFLSAEDIEFPLIHPRSMVVDSSADLFTYYSHFRNVGHLRLIWLYRLWDGAYAILKQAKRRLLRQTYR